MVSSSSIYVTTVAYTKFLQTCAVTGIAVIGCWGTVGGPAGGLVTTGGALMGCCTRKKLTNGVSHNGSRVNLKQEPPSAYLCCHWHSC